MLKQSPSRIQRSKGFKVKHALQICLLLAICIWLLYQVKQTYDKKTALEEISGKIPKEVQNGHEILELGRKGLNPQLKEIAAEFEKHGDDEELEEEDEESKIRENEGERRGGGDDEIDESDQEKAEEEEPEQLEDLIDEDDKEKEEGSEGKGVETDIFVDLGRNSKKAQEEHYKGDDASNAIL